jgi:hypothetical protein
MLAKKGSFWSRPEGGVFLTRRGIPSLFIDHSSVDCSSPLKSSLGPYQYVETFHRIRGPTPFTMGAWV